MFNDHETPGYFEFQNQPSAPFFAVCSRNLVLQVSGVHEYVYCVHVAHVVGQTVIQSKQLLHLWPVDISRLQVWAGLSGSMGSGGGQPEPRCVLVTFCV